MAYIAHDVMQDVSFALLEYFVNTTIAESIAPGTRTVTPGSMKGVYVGARLFVDVDALREVVTVTVVTATTFTAVFARTHSALATCYGASFSSGQATSDPLFTQSEILAYLTDVQNVFMREVRPVYFAGSFTLAVGTRSYTQPSDCIRIERAEITNSPTNRPALWHTSIRDLDLEDPNWPAEQGAVTHWFNDGIDNQKYGFKPLPGLADTGELWYSQRSILVLDLTTTLLVPDIFFYYLKYGVLARAFSKDGEMRDDFRADYCQRRFELGIKLGRKLIEGTQAMLAEMQQQAVAQ